MRRLCLALIAGLIVGTTLTVVSGRSPNEQGAPMTKAPEPSCHAGRRSQLAEPPGSYIQRKLPRSWCGDVWSAAYGTDVRSAVHETTVAAERGAVAGWTSGRAERRRPVPAQLSILPSGRGHRVTPGRSSLFLGSCKGGRIGELVRQHLRAEGKAAAGSAALAQATRARADLYQRIQKGGQRMPALAHLQEADIDSLYAYLTQLAGSPDASPQSRRTTSWARLGEHVVKGTCHICHDAVGPRPSGPGDHPERNDPAVYDAAGGQTRRRFRDEGTPAARQ